MPGRPPATREAIVAHRLGCFCSDQGLSATVQAEVVEAFVVSGLAERASSTRGTYRSVLRSLGGLGRPPVATAFAGSPAPTPYSGAERAELLSMARSQRATWRRAGAMAMVALGIGAGLRAAELAALRGHDVVIGPGAVTVRAPGARARRIVVDGAYGQIVSRLARGGGDEHLFCPGTADRSYHNFVNNFARALQVAADAPKLSSGRARSSFICHPLEIGTPLAELVYISGVVEVGSLLRYARHVEGAPRSKAQLRARLRAE
jgi:integrase